MTSFSCDGMSRRSPTPLVEVSRKMKKKKKKKREKKEKDG
jgi:hypothetical protein